MVVLARTTMYHDHIVIIYKTMLRIARGGVELSRRWMVVGGRICLALVIEPTLPNVHVCRCDDQDVAEDGWGAGT